MSETQATSGLKLIDTIVSALGVAGALIGAYIAYNDYRDKARLQALSELHAAQMGMCEQVAEAAAHLYDARSQAEFEKAFDNFSSMKHGQALVLLNSKVLNEMVEVYNLGVGFRSNKAGIDFQSDVRAKLCNHAFEVAISCRRMIADGYKSEGGVLELDDHYTMGWTPGFCR